MNPEEFSGYALNKETAQLIRKYSQLKVVKWYESLQIELGKKDGKSRKTYLEFILSEYSVRMHALPTDYDISTYLFDGSNFIVMAKGGAPEIGSDYIPGDLQLAVQEARKNLTEILSLLTTELNNNSTHVTETIFPEAVPDVKQSIAQSDKLLKQSTLLRIEEVMSEYSVSRTTLYQWRKKGLLTYKRVGRLVYINRDDIEKLLGK